MGFATVVSATISFMSLLIYNGIVVCEILGKEEIVEKVWKQLMPKIKYDKFKIKSIILYIGLIGHWLAFELSTRTPMMFITAIIALISITKQMKKWL